MGRPKGSKNKKIDPKHPTVATVLKEVKENIEHTETYTVSIKIFGTVYSAIGKTLQEALSRLKPQKGTNGMSIVTVSKGTRTEEKILTRFITQRLFATSLPVRSIAMRQVMERFSL